MTMLAKPMLANTKPGPPATPVTFGVVLSLAAMATFSAAACSETSVPGGQGNDVIDDTRPEPRPPANPDTPTDAGKADSSDAGLYADGAPQVTCGGCACTPDTHFCFSGAPPRGLDPVSPNDTSPDASDGGDAGPAACPVPDASTTIQAGCNDIPADCAATPTCDCLLTALQPKYACYLVCRVPGPQFLVYCPNP